jgi:hypothetical protein
MPRQLAATEIRLDNITACLTCALTLLNELNDAFAPAFVQTISNTTLSLITAVQVIVLKMDVAVTHRMSQNVKRNKNKCVQLMENTHQVLHAITDLYLKSEPAGSMASQNLHHVGKFAQYYLYQLVRRHASMIFCRTLRRIHTYVGAQQDGNRFKHLFRQSEMNTLLKDCNSGLDHALDVFKVGASSTSVQARD